MKWAINIAKILVGVLFILSGLVKANDPLGLSYKMQEFFEVWNMDLAASSFFLKDSLIAFFHFLSAHSLALSIIIIALEIMAGVALLVGWQNKANLTLLLGLILFFTFLTGYAYASGKFKNCGCFGDCLPITPLASFIKDLVLVGLILFLFLFRTFLKSHISRQTQWITLSASLVAAVGLQWYVLSYLPLADCLPFKKGAAIAEGMKPPPNAISDSFAIQFVYEKDGKRFEFFPDNLPADLATYKYLERKDQLIRKGNAEPAIKGFALTGLSGVDSVMAVLEQPTAILYFYETETAVPGPVKANLLAMQKEAQLKKIPVYVITTSLNRTLQSFTTNELTGLQFFNVDFTAFRTAARTNPCIYVLQKGDIIEKRSLPQTETILNTIRNL